MAWAIRLARRGLYTTGPNPRVGCVLVRDGEIVGEGYHRRAGEPHAERNARCIIGVNCDKPGCLVRQGLAAQIEAFVPLPDGHRVV